MHKLCLFLFLHTIFIHEEHEGRNDNLIDSSDHATTFVYLWVLEITADFTSWACLMAVEDLANEFWKECLEIVLIFWHKTGSSMSLDFQPTYHNQCVSLLIVSNTGSSSSIINSGHDGQNWEIRWNWFSHVSVSYSVNCSALLLKGKAFDLLVHLLSNPFLCSWDLSIYWMNEIMGTTGRNQFPSVAGLSLRDGGRCLHMWWEYGV